MKQQTGLVLEGGGMRGIFTAGVLDCFLENDIIFDECIGVSAGSCHGCSYASGQHGRALATSTSYLNDKRYCSLYSLITTGDLFGAEFAYHVIPNELNPIDNDAYERRGIRMWTVVTNCLTGKAEYHLMRNLRDEVDWVRASSSLPFASRMVMLDGVPYLDGGISDSIPIAQSLRQGNTKNVVVLTQPKGYYKSKNKSGLLMKLKYRHFPELVEDMKKRHIVYNQTIGQLEKMEQEGKVLIIRPPQSLGLRRIEKDKEKLLAAYRVGYQTAQVLLPQIQQFLSD